MNISAVSTFNIGESHGSIEKLSVAAKEFLLKPYIPLLLLVFSLAGCLPLVRESYAPQISHYWFKEFSPREDETTLVIPVWKKAPLIMSEESIRTSSTIWFEEPVFTKAGSLSQVHDQIPTKTTTALIVGPGGAIGSGVSFYGYVIVSEKGSLLLRDQSRDLTRQGAINDSIKKDLIRLMDTGELAGNEYSELRQFFDGKEIHLGFGNTERKQVTSFLINVPALPSN